MGSPYCTLAADAIVVTAGGPYHGSESATEGGLVLRRVPRDRDNVCFNKVLSNRGRKNQNGGALRKLT